MSDLGSLFVPQGASQVDPNLASEWETYLKKPEVRAGLLSFGLQAMTGGWGSSGQNLAQAVGAGMESYAGAQKLNEDFNLAERTRNDVLNEKATERSLRRELNTADNVAAMERTKVGSNAAKELRQDQMFWDRAVNSKVAAMRRENAAATLAYTKAKDLNPEAPEPTLHSEESMITEAQKYADDLLSARGHRTGRSMAKDIGGPVSGPKNERKLPLGEMPGPSGPTGQTPASGAPSEGAIKTPTNSATTYSLSDPAIAAKWADPAVKKQIMDRGYQEFDGELRTQVPLSWKLISGGKFVDTYLKPDGTTINIQSKFRN